jgi:AraC-like DNA-binding protein
LRAAMDTGFNSSDYFAVVFKKYTLQTPSEFIQSIHKARFQNKQTG